MSHFTGHLQISPNDQSFLDTALLVMGNPPDISIATRFLRGKGFGNGMLITVAGTISTLAGHSAVILMTDAIGSGP